jgi:hypothetical protein
MTLPDTYSEIFAINVLKVPLPGGQAVEDNFQELNLRDPSQEILVELRDYVNSHITHSSRQVESPSFPRIVSHSPSRSRNPDYEVLTNQLADLSSKYEALLLSHQALIKQVYSLPVETPEFLILNGLKVKFIPFSEVNSIQIERWLIDPMLQVWSDLPNKIITLFGNNGMTYLVKARYDPVSNQIFSP